jgi:hypothetical protein
MSAFSRIRSGEGCLRIPGRPWVFRFDGWPEMSGPLGSGGPGVAARFIVNTTPPATARAPNWARQSRVPTTRRPPIAWSPAELVEVSVGHVGNPAHGGKTDRQDDVVVLAQPRLAHHVDRIQVSPVGTAFGDNRVTDLTQVWYLAEILQQLLCEGIQVRPATYRQCAGSQILPTGTTRHQDPSTRRPKRPGTRAADAAGPNSRLAAERCCVDDSLGRPATAAVVLVRGSRR